HQAIMATEEQKRDAGPRAQADAIQAKYTGSVAKDFAARVSSLVDSGVLVRKPRWEQELNAGAPPNPPPPNPPPTNPPTGSNDGGATPPPTTPTETTSHTANPAPRSPASSKAYLKEMPAPARVVHDIQYADQAEMVACQMGAFTWLKSAIYQMNGMNLFTS